MEKNKPGYNISLKETEKKQISILKSGNLKAIIDTIQEIRESGSISVLPEIFELLLITEDEAVTHACAALLNDLKSKEARDIIISVLKDNKYNSIKNIVVSACWQNGLDYHEDILLFADIIIKDDYATAIEAFTLIENSLGEIEDKDLVKLLDTLNSGLTKIEDQKKSLLEELISVVRHY